MIPDRFRNDVGSCLIALDMATRLGFSPIAVMQQMYVVHGQPGFEAKFIIACVAASGQYSRLRFVNNGKTGDENGVYAVAKELKTGDELVGTTVTWSMVNGEGWNKDSKTKTGYVQKSKWNTMPEQMFKYRAASFWAKEHAPGMLMGIPTTDELVDVGPARVTGRSDNGSGPLTIDDVAAELEKAADEESGRSVDGLPDPPEDAAVEALRSNLIGLATELRGDDAMRYLSDMCRNRKIEDRPAGFFVMEATAEELGWAIDEISDQLDALEAERTEL
jgi:hypothetical protein